MMFTIKTIKDYFIILKDGKEFCRVAKAKNSIEEVKKYFEIEVEE